MIYMFFIGNDRKRFVRKHGNVLFPFVSYWKPFVFTYITVILHDRVKCFLFPLKTILQ